MTKSEIETADVERLTNEQKKAYRDWLEMYEQRGRTGETLRAFEYLMMVEDELANRQQASRQQKGESR